MKILSYEQQVDCGFVPFHSHGFNSWYHAPGMDPVIRQVNINFHSGFDSLLILSARIKQSLKEGTL